jgi:hypothetical protein
VPTRRDLSLALGNAGVDPVRIRTWPTPIETQRLLAGASIDGTEFLEREAPSLSRHEIELIAKPYGARLSVLVDEWERVRGALVEEEAADPPA